MPDVDFNVLLSDRLYESNLVEAFLKTRNERERGGAKETRVLVSSKHLKIILPGCPLGSFLLKIHSLQTVLTSFPRVAWLLQQKLVSGTRLSLCLNSSTC